MDRINFLSLANTFVVLILKLEIVNNIIEIVLICPLRTFYRILLNDTV